MKTVEIELKNPETGDYVYRDVTDLSAYCLEDIARQFWTDEESYEMEAIDAAPGEILRKWTELVGTDRAIDVLKVCGDLHDFYTSYASIRLYTTTNNDITRFVNSAHIAHTHAYYYADKYDDDRELYNALYDDEYEYEIDINADRKRFIDFTTFVVKDNSALIISFDDPSQRVLVVDNIDERQSIVDKYQSDYVDFCVQLRDES